MKSRVVAFLIYFGLSAMGGLAQSRLIVSAPDSLSFLLFVDNAQINTVPVSTIHLSKLNVGKHNIKVVVQSQESVLSLTTKNLISHSLSVSVVNNKLELLISGELKIQAKSFQNWKNGSLPSLVKDSVYVGKKGCDKPAIASKVDSIVLILKSKSFDTERKMVACMQLEADCFLVKDIVKIISTIELEENRMDCIVASLTQVYDLAVISELLNLVILERNKEALQQKISQLQNQ
jgi:hypothetical protein